MAEDNKTHRAPDAHDKFESSKTHARKAAEDLRSAAGAMAEEYRGFELKEEGIQATGYKSVWTARKGGKIKGWNKYLPLLKAHIDAGDCGRAAAKDVQPVGMKGVDPRQKPINIAPIAKVIPRSKRPKVEDASPFEVDTDAGAAKIVKRESKTMTSAEIARKYGFSLSFVKEVLSETGKGSLNAVLASRAKDVAPVDPPSSSYRRVEREYQELSRKGLTGAELEETLENKVGASAMNMWKREQKEKGNSRDVAPVGDEDKHEPHPFKGPGSTSYCYQCGYGRLSPIHNGGKAKDVASVGDASDDPDSKSATFRKAYYADQKAYWTRVSAAPAQHSVPPAIAKKMLNESDKNLKKAEAEIANRKRTKDVDPVGDVRAADMQEAICKNCGKQIYRLRSNAQSWYHTKSTIARCANKPTYAESTGPITSRPDTLKGHDTEYNMAKIYSVMLQKSGSSGVKIVKIRVTNTNEDPEHIAKVKYPDYKVLGSSY